VADQLFATLDSTTRKLVLPPSLEVLLTDTVGFIRRLPHYLVAAFRSTLDEVLSADVLLHVVDAAHSEWEAQMDVVAQVLQELGAEGKPVILVLNKMDQVRPMRRRRLAHQFPTGVPISATTGEGLDTLRALLAERLTQAWPLCTFQIPYERSDVRSLLVRRGQMHQQNLVSHLTPYDAAYREAMLRATALLHSRGASLPDAARKAGGMVYGSMLRQAAMLSFADAFWLMAVLFVLIIPLMFLMKRTGPVEGPVAVE